MKLRILTFLILFLLPVTAAAQSVEPSHPTVNIKISIPPETLSTGVEASRPLPEQIDFVIYRENDDCVMSELEMRGACRMTDNDELGIYFHGYSATCTGPKNRVSRLFEHAADNSQEDRQRDLIGQHHADGPFWGARESRTDLLEP